MILLLATNNAHKAKEFRQIFPGHRIVTPQDAGLTFDHEETGRSFFENAFGKAEALYRQLSSLSLLKDEYAVLADDSGLVVPALGGEPGIYSARYGSMAGGPPLDDGDRNRLLLEKLEGIQDRRAYYVCSMVLYEGSDRFSVVQETWHGEIAREASLGKTGFGYDPIFFLPEYELTVADLDPREKNRLSHRGKAVRRLVKLL